MFEPIFDGIPSYHVPMLNDKDRNQAYEAAIKETIAQFVQEQGRAPTVLDLGAGSGLLSIMALHHGASEVTLVEANADLIAIAQQEHWRKLSKMKT